MTRTEQELRALLTLPVEPESIDRVQRALRQRAHPAPARRPWLLPATAAVGVATVVFATVMGVGVARDRMQRPTGVTPLTTLQRPRPTTPRTFSSPQPPSAVPAPAQLPITRQYATLAAGTGYALDVQQFFADSQTAIITRNGATTGVTLDVYARSFPPSFTPDTTQPAVDINGVTGHWVHVAPGIRTGGAQSSLRLEWNYAPDGIALVAPAGQSAAQRADAVAVARAARFDTPADYPVPLTIHALPNGLTLEGVVLSSATRDGLTGTAGLDTLIDFSTPGYNGTALTIDYGGTAYFGSVDRSGGTVTLNGRPWTWDGGHTTLVTQGTDYIVRVNLVDTGRYTRTQLERFVAELTLAPTFADPATWPTAAQALPTS